MSNFNTLRHFFEHEKITAMRKSNGEVVRLLMNKECADFIEKLFANKQLTPPAITLISSDTYIMQPELLLVLYPDKAAELLSDAARYHAPQTEKKMAETRLTSRGLF